VKYGWVTFSISRAHVLNIYIYIYKGKSCTAQSTLLYTFVHRTRSSCKHQRVRSLFLVFLERIRSGEFYNLSSPPPTCKRHFSNVWNVWRRHILLWYIVSNFLVRKCEHISDIFFHITGKLLRCIIMVTRNKNIITIAMVVRRRQRRQ